MHNMHRPEICLPNSDFRLAHTFPPLELMISGQALIFSHQLYHRGQQPLHLFHAMAEDPESAELRRQYDWSFRGRVEAAFAGYRSRHVDIIHLLYTGPADMMQIRRAAEDVLPRVVHLENLHDTIP